MQKRLVSHDRGVFNLIFEHKKTLFDSNVPVVVYETTFCFTYCMMINDSLAAERLDAAVQVFSANGFVGLAQEAASATWRANRERYEPDALFDDSTTLGFQSSRNFSNRMYHYLAVEGRLGQEVSVRRDQGAVAIRAGGFELRFVKSPLSSGRRPDFSADFDWSASITRFSAAARNAGSHRPLPAMPGMDPLFAIEDPNAVAQIEECADIFLIWGGDAGSGLTGGWLGLPTVSALPFLAVHPLWWDEGDRSGVEVPSIWIPDTDVDFGTAEVPLPVLRLKKTTKEGESS